MNIQKTTELDFETARALAERLASSGERFVPHVSLSHVRMDVGRVNAAGVKYGPAVVMIRDADRDHERPRWPSDFRGHLKGENFCAEGEAYAHIYTFADDVPEYIVENLSFVGLLNIKILADRVAALVVKGASQKTRENHAR